MFIYLSGPTLPSTSTHLTKSTSSPRRTTTPRTSRRTTSSATTKKVHTKTQKPSKPQLFSTKLLNHVSVFFGFFFFFFFFPKIKKIKSNFKSNLVSIEKLSFRLLKEVNFTRKFSNFGRNLSKNYYSYLQLSWVSLWGMWIDFIMWFLSGKEQNPLRVGLSHGCVRCMLGNWKVVAMVTELPVIDSGLQRSLVKGLNGLK